MTRDDKRKSICFAILWVVLYYILLFATSTLVFLLMKLPIFGWIYDIEDYDELFRKVIVYLITGWISLFISSQIQSIAIKEKDILEYSHWISGTALISIGVVFFIIFAIVAHMVEGVVSKFSFIYSGAIISITTIVAMIFAAYRLPDQHIDKDGIKKATVVVIVIVMFLVSSSVLLELFFTNESTITVYDEHIEVEEVEIETYICYITDTGSLYHSRNCQYLWNSSYRTTVYEARENGYGACSKCTPKTKTTLILEKSNVIQIPRQETEINKNYIFPTILGAVFTGGVAISTILIKKRISKKTKTD